MIDPNSDDAREIARYVLIAFSQHWHENGYRARPNTVADAVLDWAHEIRTGERDIYGVKVTQQ